jgi:hypothetical protein
MKALTDKQRQWFWFAALWCGGLVATAALAKIFRWVVWL